MSTHLNLLRVLEQKDTVRARLAVVHSHKSRGLYNTEVYCHYNIGTTYLGMAYNGRRGHRGQLVCYSHNSHFIIVQPLHVV